MAPSDYISARQPLHREASSDAATDYFLRVVVDDKPYFPFWHVTEHGGWETSCRRAVAAIFYFPNNEESPDLCLLKVRPVQGGNTNLLFCVSNLCRIKDGAPDKVLVRIFGGHGLIDRDVETSTYAALAAQGFALPYYGRFGNGRVEGWSDGKCLNREEMGRYAIPIARAMATLHGTFRIPTALQDYHCPTQTPTMWVQLNDWIGSAVNATFQSDRDLERATGLRVPQWQNELIFLKQDVIAQDSAVGFCHNDVLASNIMCDEATQQVQLIDFEYGGMNYWGYDIANFFNEFAGGTDSSATPDYSLFPSLELQTLFVTEYLTTRRRLLMKDSPPSSTEVNALLTEISGFVLANHLVWALWAVNQASTVGCNEFDYLQYAKCRIERYFCDKAKWVERNRST